MRIDRIELRLVRLPLVHFFETSFGRVHDKAFILVRLLAGGLEAWGECVAEETPYYSAETTETAWHVITGFLGPRLLALDLEHPRQVFPAFRAVRGHNMAKAALEMAAWDLQARADGQPLSRLLGGQRTRIASGVSVGIQDSLDDLAANDPDGAGRRLPAGEDQDQARLGHRGRPDGARALRRDPPDGGRECGLHHWRTPAIWRRSTRSI